MWCWGTLEEEEEEEEEGWTHFLINKGIKGTKQTDGLTELRIANSCSSVKMSPNLLPK